MLMNTVHWDRSHYTSYLCKLALLPPSDLPDAHEPEFAQVTCVVSTNPYGIR